MIPQDLLDQISYNSNLGCSLKTSLTRITWQDLAEDLAHCIDHYRSPEVSDLLDYIALNGIDSRIKSFHSCQLKYQRHLGSRSIETCFNDLLSFRAIIEDWNELGETSYFRVADMRSGKSKDDGYRGVHLYYQPTHFHYPIEVQVNTAYDRYLNDLLHTYLYKYTSDPGIGRYARDCYDRGYINSEQDFKDIIYQEFNIRL